MFLLYKTLIYVFRRYIKTQIVTYYNKCWLHIINKKFTIVRLFSEQ